MKPNLSRHHKRCRSNGGSDKKSNLSYVPQKRHSAYHYLFSNSLPPDMCDLITRLLRNDKTLSPRHFMEWKKLVGSRSPEKAMKYLNASFIDPRYILDCFKGGVDGLWYVYHIQILDYDP